MPDNTNTPTAPTDLGTLRAGIEAAIGPTPDAYTAHRELMARGYRDLAQALADALEANLYDRPGAPPRTIGDLERLARKAFRVPADALTRARDRYIAHQGEAERTRIYPPLTGAGAPSLGRYYDPALDAYVPIESPPPPPALPLTAREELRLHAAMQMPIAGADLDDVELLHYTERVGRSRPPAPAPTFTTSIGEADAGMDAEYSALVAELGLARDAVDGERIKTLVGELGLHVYDRAQVDAYLHHAYNVPPGGMTPRVVWGWRPLREADRDPRAATHGYNGKLQPAAAPYTKPIPYPVLRTVKAIRDACPSARFFVSDDMHGEKIPDPFLLVIIAGQEYVIERWDEPAFRERAPQ